MAFCSSCGTPNTDTAKFCTGCGKAMSSVANAASDPAPAELKRSTVEKPLGLTNTVPKPSVDSVDMLFKQYLALATITTFFATMLAIQNVFPTEVYIGWKGVLAFEVIWYFIGFVCLKFMAINKQRPGWALGFLIINIVLFVWYLTIEDGGFSRLMMIPEVMPQTAGTGYGLSKVLWLNQAVFACTVVWDEFLGPLFEIIIIYKIFIKVKTSKIKNEQNI
jgi:hypothetical protein